MCWLWKELFLTRNEWFALQISVAWCICVVFRAVWHSCKSVDLVERVPRTELRSFESGKALGIVEHLKSESFASKILPASRSSSGTCSSSLCHFRLLIIMALNALKSHFKPDSSTSSNGTSDSSPKTLDSCFPVLSHEESLEFRLFGFSLLGFRFLLSR